MAASLLLLIVFRLAVIAIHSSQPTPSINLGTSNSNNSSQQQGPEEFLWSPWTWPPVTLSTFILTGATCGLLLYTARLWDATERSLREAKETSVAAINASVVAANAAMKSADAAVAALNRPWLAFEIDSSNVREARFEEDRALKIRFSFHNYGDTFAEIVGGWLHYGHHNSYPLKDIEYNFFIGWKFIEETAELVNTRVAAGFSTPIVTESYSVYTQFQHSRAFSVTMHNDDTDVIGIFGQLFYRGPTGNAIYTTAFSYRLNVMRSAFVMDPDAKRNYRT